MKSFKLTKCVQVFLITLLIIVIGIILVTLASNGKVGAGTVKCPNCSEYMLDTYYSPAETGTHKYGYTCSKCKFYGLYGEESCSGGTHINGGKCTKCGEKYQTHSNKVTYEPLAGGDIKQYTYVHLASVDGLQRVHQKVVQEQHTKMVENVLNVERFMKII